MRRENPMNPWLGVPTVAVVAVVMAAETPAAVQTCEYHHAEVLRTARGQK
jgi:hypothetical protein